MKINEKRIIDRPAMDPTHAPGKPPLPPLRHGYITHEDALQEKDVPITMRDGITIFADLYRPVAVNAPLPVLLAWGPYGKHNTKDHLFPGAGVEEGWISGLTGFEAPDPAYWCPKGYIIAYVDPRGMWNSEGEGRHNGPQEAEDIFDAVEWLGSCDYSTGRVGMLGVSYLAGAQFIAAAMAPPALAAISPWECFTDWYREFAYHGGIPEAGFMPRASMNMGFSRTRTEDTAANVAARPLDSDYYRSKYPPLEDIRVPSYVVASWSDHGLHTRGTLEAFSRIGSQNKWLEVHGQKKWRYFYDPESVRKQQQFFDYYLHDKGPGPNDWPKVLLEVRDRGSQGAHRSDISWPVDETHASRLQLDFNNSSLSASAVPVSSHSMESTTQEVSLTYTFSKPTDVIGPMRLRLWLETEDADDADVFVAIRKFNEVGEEIRFPFNALFDDGPVALGWLRASHREVDQRASSELRPVHPHASIDPLVPGKPVPLEIEIWPSATHFRAGEKLTLTILGRDFVERDPNLLSPVIRHEQLRNAGWWRLHSGGKCDSHLALYTTAPNYSSTQNRN